ncbi:hypothetical protein KO361_01715 [Candidatus Woesearchaeota archaeon]|nr:hypothetical protein [Candidatus Woesearchaeota archaeon]
MEIVNRQNKILFEGFSIFSILILLAIIIISAFSTNSPLLFVVIGFLPSLITIILSLVLYEESFHHKITIWFIPLIITGSFFLIGTNYEYMNYNMDVATLTSINIIYSVLYLTMFFTIIRITRKKPKQTKEQKPVQLKEQNIQEYIASIEEKSKALNFVIGRVYNKYHGGTQELRKSINLKPDWYNELSEALQNEEKTDTKRLFTIIEKIESHLKNLKKPENQVLTKKQLQDLKNLDRDKEGKDTILEVLMKNDADPVELYYKGMQEFCETIRKELEEKKQ